MKASPSNHARLWLPLTAAFAVTLASPGCSDGEPMETSETGQSTSESTTGTDTTADPTGDPTSGPTGTGTETGTSAGPTTSPTSTDPTTSTTTDDPTTGTTTDDPTTGTDTGVQDGLVRFIAMGDGGEGNETQYKVANAIEMLCPDIGCDFVIYLGDNFYDEGVDAVDDLQFMTKFEEPYADLSLPFYITLGNHDYGLIANNWSKAEYQVDYSDFSEKWTLPAPWYEFTREHVQFWSLDTSRIFWDFQWDEQLDWLNNGTANSDATWKFAFGHHPYISNGAHGNAGNYEGLPFPIPIVSGEDVKDFMDDGLCGKIDVYFCGHDHNRQWLEPVCGTEFIVSGTAAKHTDLEHHDDQPTKWEDDLEGGFLWVEVDGNTLHGVFYDEDGNIDFEHTIQK